MKQSIYAIQSDLSAMYYFAKLEQKTAQEIKLMFNNKTNGYFSAKTGKTVKRPMYTNSEKSSILLMHHVSLDTIRLSCVFGYVYKGDVYTTEDDKAGYKFKVEYLYSTSGLGFSGSKMDSLDKGFFYPETMKRFS